MRILLSISALFLAVFARAAYAPQATIGGTTAISKTSPLFKAWATQCVVQRGLQQINDASFGYASLGDSSSALGAPDGNGLSLGDGGSAIVSFASPIQNGPGFDFAVFENGFANPLNPEEAFLELAFVEVSSDGVHFVRFPASSETQDTVQLSSVSAPSYTNARHLNNLAGKYIAGYGTPFDLQELADSPHLDINHIIKVRLIDAVGSIGAEGTTDASGRKINDPFPTPFASSGFDLDAVGVLHGGASSIAEQENSAIILSPNPANESLHICLPNPSGVVVVKLFNAMGQEISRREVVASSFDFDLRNIPAGSYFISIQFKDGNRCTKAFLHR